MKKLLLAILLILGCLLGACSNEPAVETEIAPEITSEPASNSNTEPESNSTTESYSYYPVADKLERIYLGSGYEEDPFFIALNEEERLEIWSLMRIDEWVIAEDIPIGGFAEEFYLQEGPQKWLFNQYDGQALIVPSLRDPDGMRTCYYAPVDIITDIKTYTEALMP